MTLPIIRAAQVGIVRGDTCVNREAAIGSLHIPGQRFYHRVEFDVTFDRRNGSAASWPSRMLKGTLLSPAADRGPCQVDLWPLETASLKGAEHVRKHGWLRTVYEIVPLEKPLSGPTSSASRRLSKNSPHTDHGLSKLFTRVAVTRRYPSTFQSCRVLRPLEHCYLPELAIAGVLLDGASVNRRVMQSPPRRGG